MLMMTSSTCWMCSSMVSAVGNSEGIALEIVEDGGDGAQTRCCETHESRARGAPRVQLSGSRGQLGTSSVRVALAVALNFDVTSTAEVTY